MRWYPVEYREVCGMVRGVWTVKGLAHTMPPAPRVCCSFMERWPAGESPQSQPDRLHWFRARLFGWVEHEVTRAEDRMT